MNESPSVVETDLATSIPWHSSEIDDLLQQLDSSVEGLDADEAALRLQRHGPNQLTPPKPVSALSVLLAQFRSLIVVLLLGAAAVALVLGDLLEAGAIGAVLALNTLIGFAVELRARRAMDALLSYEVLVARVVRGGQVESISSDRLVPGDVIELIEGDRVPADARMISGAELQLNEAPLTGESLPVAKSPERMDDPGALLADRRSMLYAGTSVYVGIARALVVETGADTQIGKIGTLLATVESRKTPLEVRLDRLGQRLVWLTLGVAALVTLLGVVQGIPVGQMIEVGIALAIAAVPEGLPAVATIALAVGLRRMARRNALVRRLSAVEALGATTVVCTDKTGTLTAGKMIATTVGGLDGTIDVRDQPPETPWLVPLLKAAALTSRATLDSHTDELVGDPTDVALTRLAMKGGVDPAELLERLPQTDEIPFSSKRMASASIHTRSGEAVVFVKGAPETIIDMSVLDDGARSQLLDLNSSFAERGLRVIALAEGCAEGDHDSLLRDLTFLGLIGIMDPPAEGVAATLEILRQAQIRTIMITGDQQATGEAIARDLGMLDEGSEALGGRELAKHSRSEAKS